MSLRSKARRAGPEIPDYTRTSAHALNLDHYVPAYLTYLAGKISSSASATYRPRFGVGITDWRIMALLASEPWISAGRLCDVIGLDKAAVSRSVRGMKLIGIVDFQWADEDQHRQLIALTRKGLIAAAGTATAQELFRGRAKDADQFSLAHACAGRRRQRDREAARHFISCLCQFILAKYPNNRLPWLGGMFAWMPRGKNCHSLIFLKIIVGHMGC